MNRSQIAVILIGFLVAWGEPSLVAQESPEEPQKEAQGEAQDEDIAALLAVLAEETEVATRTRLNSDFVPGIVTVLEGSELEAVGVQNAWEALSLVPGIQPVRSPGGDPTVVVRGLGFPFNSGNIKILINGVPVTREATGINPAALLMPVEQIDRIEVIRGPGSVIYGDFAFMGIVNIITRREIGADITTDFDGTLRGGLRGAMGGKDGGWNLAASLSAFTSTNPVVAQPSDAEEDGSFAVVTFGRGGFSASVQSVARDIEGHSGPVATGDERSLAIDGRYHRKLADGLEAEAHLSWFDNELTTGGSGGASTMAEGGVELLWTALPKNSILLAADYSSLEIESARHARPAPPGIPPPPILEVSGEHRRTTGVTVQDQIALHERFSLVLGVRWDHYSDIGEDRLTPRVAALWHVAGGDVIKAQYSEGFRGPTFFELYDDEGRNPTLDFEVNRTTELAWIHRLPMAVSRLTLFDARLDDMLFTDGPTTGFSNSREASSRGIEAEWEQQISPSLRVLANVSWLDETSDTRGAFPVEHESFVASEWMGNLAVYWKVAAKTLLSARWNYVGDRSPEGEDGYRLLDVTIARSDVLAPGLTVRAIVKNAFDDEVVHFYELPFGASPYVFPGRAVLAQVGWRR